MAVLVVVALLVGGVYVAGWALTGDRLPRGARVGDVGVGGLSPGCGPPQGRPRDRGPGLHDPSRCRDRGRSFRIRPADVGLEVDVSGSVAQVPVGRTWDPRDMWESLVGSTDVPLLTVAVGDALERRVGRIADQVDQPVVEGAVTVARTGRPPAPSIPQAGHLLDRDRRRRSGGVGLPVVGAAGRADAGRHGAGGLGAEVSRAMRTSPTPPCRAR